MRPDSRSGDGSAVPQTWRVPLVSDLTRSHLVQYAGASGDFNPLHTDEVYASQVAGHRTVMAHGMLTIGLTGRAVTDLFGRTSLQRFGGRFRAPVWPGDDLVADVVVTAGNHLSTEGPITVAFHITNQDGLVVLEREAGVVREQEG